MDTSFDPKRGGLASRRTGPSLVLAAVAVFSFGCGSPHLAVPPSGPASPDASAAYAAQVAGEPAAAGQNRDEAAAAPSEERAPGASSLWVGAAGASELVLPGARDTVLGVWIDVPTAAKKVRAPVALSLVIDTSGSMAGPKIEHARAAARALVQNLEDGDLVAIEQFSDDAREIVPPTFLSTSSRPSVLSAIDELGANGGTNLFEGLRLGELRAMAAPATHPVRRVVVVSDGMANLGPSSPELLGELAARGAERDVQVTSIGVGLDYDERTLNALAVRSSGRLHHLADAREMTAILRRELGLLQGTMAAGAYIDVVPAPGVQILGADGVRADRVGDGVRIPLGTMFGGQHREMLVRLRVDAPQGGGKRPLASVRLCFRDPGDGNVERVQEVIARYEVTDDPAAVARTRSERTGSIVAVQEAAQLAVQAAQQVNQGRFDDAERQLAMAEQKVRDGARHVKDAAERRRMEAVAASMSTARATARKAQTTPSAAKAAASRSVALDINSTGMHAAGY